MTWQTTIYFLSVFITFLLTGFLAWYAWRQGSLPVARPYAWLCLSECLLALTEIFSMLSTSEKMAYFWFNGRFLFTASIPVFFLFFALEYSARRKWHSKGFFAGIFLIPLLTQIFLWTNPLHHLWVTSDVGFFQEGVVWLNEPGLRVPASWFLVHTFYSNVLMLTSVIILLVAAWKKGRTYLWQSFLLTSGALVGILAGLIPVFNLLPQIKFNPFIPGIGLSALLYALVILRFDFQKHSPGMESAEGGRALDRQEKRSLAIFLLIFILLATGIVSVGYDSFRNFQQDHRAQTEEHLSSIASLKLADIERWHEERNRDGEVLLHNTTFSTLVRRALEQPPAEESLMQLQVWLDETRAAYEYTRIYLLETNGELVIASPAGATDVPEHIDLELTHALQTGQVIFLDFHRHTSGAIFLGLLVPIYSDLDTSIPLGVVIMEIDPSTFLYPYLQEWPEPSETAETLLVRRDGEEVLFLNPLRFDPQAAFNLRFPLTDTDIIAVKAVLGETGIVEGLDYRGEQVIGAIEPVQSMPWFLVARMDITEVYAPLQTRLWQTLVFFGALLLSSGAGLILVWRQQQLRHFKARFESAEALRESEARYRHTLDEMLEGCQIIGWDWKYIYINDMAEKHNRRPKEELLGKIFMEMWSDVDSLQIYTALKKCMEERQPALLESMFVFPDGGEGVFNLRVYPVPEGIVVFSMDVTEEKRVEQQLDIQARLASIFLTFPDDEMYNEVLKLVLGVLDSPLGVFGYINEAQDLVVPTMTRQVWSQCQVAEKTIIFPHNTWGKSSWPLAIHEKKPNSSNKSSTGIPEGHMSITRHINMPILYQDEVIGLFQVANKGEDYTEEDLQTLKNIAHQVSPLLSARLQREQAEKALRDSEEKFRKAFTISPDAVGITRLDGTFISVNQGFENILGYPVQETLGKTVQELNIWVNPAERPKLITMLKDTGQVYNFETQFRAKNGEVHDCLVSVVLIELKGEQLILNTTRDITERKQAEEEKNRLWQVLDHSLNEILIFDAKTFQFQYANRGACQNLGFSTGQLNTMTLLDINPELTVKSFQRLVAPLLRKKKEKIIFESVHCRADGSLYPVEVHLQLDHHEGIDRFLAIISDITLRRKAEAALQQYSTRLEVEVEDRTRDLRDAQEKLIRQEKLAMLGQISGSIGHELRNPLGVISNATYLLRMSQPDASDTVREYLGIIETETHKSEKIITDLLDFTRSRAATRKPAVVDALIRSVIERYPAPTTVKLLVKIPVKLPKVLVDKTQVEQVLGNLVMNAYQAMPGDGKLTISARVAENRVGVAVRDTGVGIPAENMPKLFEPLFTTKSRGIGLGLAVCRKLAEINGGEIEVASTPGKGSTFTLWLPVSKEKN